MSEIEEMINSSDLDCRYLAVSMLRNNSNLFSKKDVKLIKKVKLEDRIRNIHDVYSELGIKEGAVSIFKNPQTKFEKYINACAIIPKISEVFNEGWIPNFNNSKEYKYFPYFIKDKVSGSGWLVCSGYYDGDDACMGSGFYFKTDILAKLAGERFIDIYIDYLPE
jgi:hypothetical protein